jgi:hypothetical protein
MLMLEDFSIRIFRKEDLPSIRSLKLEAENFGELFLEPELLNIKRDSNPDFGRVYVALLEESIVGYVTLRKNIFAQHISELQNRLNV